MAELITNNTIKIIIGMAVIAAMVFGAYLIFKDKIFAFIDGIGVEVIRGIFR